MVEDDVVAIGTATDLGVDEDTVCAVHSLATSSVSLLVPVTVECHDEAIGNGYSLLTFTPNQISLLKSKLTDCVTLIGVNETVAVNANESIHTIGASRHLTLHELNLMNSDLVDGVFYSNDHEAQSVEFDNLTVRLSSDGTSFTLKGETDDGLTMQTRDIDIDELSFDDLDDVIIDLDAKELEIYDQDHGTVSQEIVVASLVELESIANEHIQGGFESVIEVTAGNLSRMIVKMIIRHETIDDLVNDLIDHYGLNMVKAA
jgi:hypothetical protein